MRHAAEQGLTRFRPDTEPEPLDKAELLEIEGECRGERRALLAATDEAYRAGARGQAFAACVLDRVKTLGGGERDARWLDHAYQETLFSARNQFHEKWSTADPGMAPPDHLDAIQAYVREPDPLRASIVRTHERRPVRRRGRRPQGVPTQSSFPEFSLGRNVWRAQRLSSAVPPTSSGTGSRAGGASTYPSTVAVQTVRGMNAAVPSIPRRSAR